MLKTIKYYVKENTFSWQMLSITAVKQIKRMKQLKLTTMFLLSSIFRQKARALILHRIRYLASQGSAR